MTLEEYYCKFHEENRLKTRHGQVEYTVAMKYISEFCNRVINNNNSPKKSLKVLDIGAGTGVYSSALCKMGYDVTAVELTRCNFDKLRNRHENIKAWQGDARDLHFLSDATFDITLVFGPLYHLHTISDKNQVLSEARRVTKPRGYIFCNYLMNEYAVITYCFKSGNLSNSNLTQDFHTVTDSKDLYSYVRISDIDSLNKNCALKSIKRVALDGPADYMRRELNSLCDSDFQKFIEYQMAICEYPELLGASSHLLDILQPIFYK